MHEVDAPEPRKRDVSCLALTLFYDYLESRGLSRRPLQAGLPYPPDYLDDRTNWIDYETFLEMERRMATLLPDEPDLYFRIGRTVGSSNRALAFIRIFIRAVVSPFQVYAAIPRIVPRFLFPRVRISFTRTSARSVRGHYVFEPGYSPSDAWVETARGILAGVPCKMGVPKAVVKARRVGDHEVIYDLELSPQWLGPIEFVKRLWRRVVGTVSMRVRNVTDAVRELDETNRLLNEKVEALTEAKAALDEKVRQLTILNALSRAAASELDVARLLRRTVDVVSEQLGGAPAAILVAEGEPPGLVCAAGAGLDRAARRAIGGLARPDAEGTRRVVRERKPTFVVVGDESWIVVPMICRDRVLGALVLGGGETVHAETALLEAMAGQLAVALDNAQSYQLVAELRDNLEVRVHERTLELEAARDALAATVTRLERSDRAMRDFFTNVSHEFRTPLTLILAPLDDLRAALERAGITEAQPVVDHVARNAHALLRLINEILDFAKLDARQMPMNPECFDLVAFVADLVDRIRPLAERKRLALHYEQPDVAIEVSADPKLLRRAIVNLLSNAVKYVDEGDRITVRVAVDQDRAVVEVADTGPGIPADQRDLVFERFQRVQDNRGDVVEGSGVGLAMVKEIVQLHKGRIELECPPSGGSVFRIRLDARAVLPKGSALTTSMPVEEPRPLTAVFSDVPPTPPAEAPADGARVLLVEDNAEMRSFLVRLIGRRHQVLTARDGAEGLERAAREMPDLVLSDVMMPRIDGYELCRRLKADPVTRKIPVVLISAMHGTEASVQGFEAGADDFVVKPFSPPELMARIEAQLRIRSLLRAVMRMEKQTSLGLMAAGIAHEVLNPVNAVLTAVGPLRARLEKLADAGDRDLAGALLEAVEESGTRIRDVVRAMLGLAREGDRGELVLREARLSEAIRSVMTVLNHRKGAVEVSVRHDWDEPVQCYPELLGQVVLNLVGNALDALAESGGRVEVVTECDGEQVRIRVRDDGPGIPPEDRDRIFAPFFTTKPPGEGTGLGLAIGREIAALHGGTLELETSSWGGCEFVLEFPYLAPGAAAALAS